MMIMNTAFLNPSATGLSNFLGKRRRLWACYGMLAITIASAALIRFRLRDMPLERDEGEYAYLGQLMLHGIAPYQLAYSMKLPGTYLLYAFFLKAFGQSPRAVHEGLLLTNAVTIWLVAILAARLFGWTAALAAAATYGLLSLSPSVLGFAGHATHFVVLPTVAAALLVLEAKRRSLGWLFLCGALLGLAFLMKQPSILFTAFAGLYLMWEQFRAGREQNRRMDWLNLGRSLLALLFGALLPFVFTCLLLWRARVFPRFWFWTFTYARKYAAIVSPTEGWHYFWSSIPRVIGPCWPLWLLAGFGLTAFYWDRGIRTRANFLFLFLACSFLAVCPGLYFRQHYFILLLPVVSLLVGAAVSSAMRRLPNRRIQLLPVVLFLVAWGISLFHQRDFLFRMDPVTACRSVYGINPFPEAIHIADYIQAHSAQGTRIAILGSEPEIAFYSDRISATGYIYTYGLMEAQPFASQMQREMAGEIEAAGPLFLIFVGVPTSWLPQPGSDRFIFNWARNYIRAHYDLVGLVDILPHSEYRWGTDVKSYQRRSLWSVEVYRRVG